MTLGKSDFAVFHAPYNKLVQKSFGRYLWNVSSGITSQLSRHTLPGCAR